MNYQDAIAEFNSKPPQEQHKMMMDFFGNMPYESFNHQREHYEKTMRDRARDDERKEVICRLIAAGMSVDDIALAMAWRVKEVQAIADSYQDRKIPEFVKSFKQRQKRKQKQQGG